jgi:hypothetical protein
MNNVDNWFGCHFSNKVLSIAIQDRTRVFDLVNEMTNLQALNVLCQDDKWNLQTATTEDELIQ